MSSGTANDHHLQNVAVFGAGQVGRAMLTALLNPVTEGYKPTVYAFIPPGSQKADSIRGLSDKLKVVEVDFTKGSELVEKLKGIDAIVSTLNGKGIDAQYAILDAAVKAGVKRFFPSEYGFRQVYRAPDGIGGRIHPLDDQKIRFAEKLQLHYAVDSGKLTYTFVNCGDFYNQPAETWWYPWMDPSRESFDVPVVGDGDAPADWAHLDDTANYVCAMLARPELSANRTFNVPSTTVSQNYIVDALRRHSRKPVNIVHVQMHDAHRFVQNPDAAPKELKENTRFPVDYWFVVKTTQGDGRGRHPRPEVHNSLFPEVKTTTFDDFFAKQFRK